MTEIEWLVQDQFWMHFEAEYRENGKYLNRTLHVPLSMEKIRARATISPAYTPVEDGDFPGPVERWYAKVGSNLFLVDCFYGFEGSTITLEDDSNIEVVITSALKEFEKYDPHRIEDTITSAMKEFKNTNI